MQTDASPSSSQAPAPPTTTTCAPSPGQDHCWRLALVAATPCLIILGLLLARLIWLPFFFGLFFFLVAGLLVGALAFRIARPARPIRRARILLGAVTVAWLAWLATMVWEYQHFAATAGEQPRFPTARNAAVSAGQSPTQVTARVADAFRAMLKARYSPGGPIGYARWALGGGRTTIVIEGDRDTVSTNLPGYAWAIRSFAGLLLLCAGLWASLDSLRREQPVSNVLAPGEEYEEDD